MNIILKSIFLFLILIIVTSFNSSKWKLEKSKNGIKVYSYIPEGEKLKQLKSHTVIKASLSSIVSVLSQPNNYTTWIYKCVKSKMLKKINTTEMVYCVENDAPWPVLNRELYVLNTFRQDAKSKVLYSVSKPLPNNTIPIKKNIVRVTDFYGKWKFTPLKNGEVAIDYYLKLDPAGRIPTWLLNMTLEIGPYQTMLNFKKEVIKEKHQHSKYEFIKE